MTRWVWRLAALHVGLLCLVAAWAAYWQVVRGPDLASHPSNPRVLLAEEQVYRGRILDRNMAVLAYSFRRGGRTVRVYPQGDVFAHPVGYRSLLLGKAGLEASADSYLLGIAEAGPWEDLGRRLGRVRRGLDVVTTLDSSVQRAAWRALGPGSGAAVVVEVDTGGVLAAASRPSFDPNRVEQTWGELRWSAALVDRALSGLYPPGRPFGVVVLAAVLSRGIAEPATPLECRGPHGLRLVRQVLVPDCEGALARLAAAVGDLVLRQTAEAFGLGQVPTPEAPAAAGHLPPADRLRAELPQVLAGAGSVLVSPLQMASVAATVARGGQWVQPRFVEAVRTADGRPVDRQVPSAAVQIVAPPVAASLQEAMREPVGGTGAGVTGTVRLPEGRRAAWFVGFAPGRSPRVAAAVVVEQAGEEVARAVGQKVLQAAVRVVR